jgi:hypothetical protein
VYNRGNVRLAERGNDREAAVRVAPGTACLQTVKSVMPVRETAMPRWSDSDGKTSDAVPNEWNRKMEKR